MTPLQTDLAGYTVIGRHGYLGTVVEGGGDPIVFRGGISDALLFHVPAAMVATISPGSRSVTLEVDVGDFTPRLGEDGRVELHLTG